MEGAECSSRNGKVMRLPFPAILEYTNPAERVLFDPDRDANPFFHLFESIWMLSGSNEVLLPARYAKQIREYSDDGVTLHGAYGHRWRLHFGVDQIEQVISMLRRDPDTRRAVIGMWDPHSDLDRASKDLPCNTHIYFDVNAPFLNMTVCNRSNDLVWGACGANAVHLSFLHEYIALATGFLQGTYYQFTNNLHVYEKHWPLFDLGVISDRDSDRDSDPYSARRVQPVPLFQTHDERQNFDADCRYWTDPSYDIRTAYFAGVVIPLRKAWDAYKSGDTMWALQYIQDCVAPDWRLACKEWIERRVMAKLSA
jgi:hypothetical protein